MPAQPDAFFLPADVGQRFCLFYSAHGDRVRGQVLYVHPFAEEMNKSRRMAALQARALALGGFDVLQIDLLGCGDSSGDFGDATWESWVDDVVRGCRWLRERYSAPDAAQERAPLWLWGLRLGCLLAAEAALQLEEPCNFLFWQPPSSGKPLLNQFMRLRMAGDMLGGQATEGMAGMRRQLTDGIAIDVAGYLLSPELAWGLEQASLVPPVGRGQMRRLAWFDLSTRESSSVSPATTASFAAWKQSGFDAVLHTTHSPAFWQTTEIEEAPELLEATTAVVCG